MLSSWTHDRPLPGSRREGDQRMKLCILGGGGFRTPYVYQALLRDAGSPRVEEVALYDTDAAKLAGMVTILRELAADFPDAPRLVPTDRLPDAHLAVLRGAGQRVEGPVDGDVAVPGPDDRVDAHPASRGGLVMDSPDKIVKVRDLFGIDSDMEVPAFSEADERVPDLDPAYVFDADTTLSMPQTAERVADGLTSFGDAPPPAVPGSTASTRAAGEGERTARVGIRRRYPVLQCGLPPEDAKKDAPEYELLG